jgi:hypothetical protein
MAYENKPTKISDEDKERSEEERTSLARQLDRRTFSQRQKEIRERRDDYLNTAQSIQDRREIKSKADAALEQAEANFNKKYYPSRNKEDYESDILQRGIDQFNAPESTPESSGGGGDVEFNGSVLICINGSLYYIDIPYDPDAGVYPSTNGANFPITEP